MSAPIRRSIPGESPTPEPAPNSYVTMVFDSEDEYVRFTDQVYERFGAAALELTDQPILTSIRVRRDVVEQTRGAFRMHEFGEQDRALIVAQPQPETWPFDAELIRCTPVPGVPRAVPKKQQ